MPYVSFAGFQLFKIGLQNKLFVIGGTSEGEKKVSVYNPSTDTWSKNNDCPFSTGQNAVVYNNLIYITGNDKMYAYDPVSDAWGNSYDLPGNMPAYTSIPIVYNSNLYLIAFGEDSSEITLYKFKEQ